MVALNETDPSKLVIENVGPIEKLELEPKPGTISVFRGRNGAGKSTALQTIQALTRGSSRLTSRDGFVAGKASGFGVTIKIARNGRNDRMGDVAVESIEDKFGIADLVEPGIKDPVAADAKRIKALVNLAGVSSEGDEFKDLFESPEEYDSVVKASSLKATNDDIVKMADVIKRSVDEVALREERVCEAEWSAICELRKAPADIDLDACSDEAILNERLEAATVQRAELEKQVATHEAAKFEADAARMDLKHLQSESTGLTLDEARNNVKQAMEQAKRAQSELNDAEERLFKARSALTAAQDAGVAASTQVEILERLEKQTSAMTATIERLSSLPCPTADEISKAANAIDQARAAVALGQDLRRHRERCAEADKNEQALALRRQRAERLRSLSQSVPKVLARAVAGLNAPVHVSDDFRLIVKHPARGECFFSELSHGERWALALQLFLAACEERQEPAILAIPQEAWEGLDGSNRRLIANVVKDTNMMVFTAEAAREEDPAGLAVETI